MRFKKKLISDFKKNGLIVLPKILTEKKVKSIKSKITNILKKIEKKNNSFNNLKGINAEAQAIHNLHNKDLEFVKLLSNKTILYFVEKLLKESTYLNSEDIICQKSFARNPSFNKKKQMLHTDSRFISSSKPLTINVFWLVDDFNELNGALRYVPGSHKFLRFPKNNVKYSNEKIIKALKGDVIIFDGNVWHGNEKKLKNFDRWVVAFRYSPWFYRPSFLNEYNTPTSIYKKLSDKEKVLLGFKHISPKDEFERVESRSKNFYKPVRSF